MADFGSLSPSFDDLLMQATLAARSPSPVSFGSLAGEIPQPSPAEIAAARLRRSVRPEGGRQEGAVTQGLDRAAPVAGQALGMLASIPQRAFEASETRRLGGDYDPAPVVDAAMLGLGGGMPGATRAAGEAALNPMRYLRDAGEAAAAAPRTAAAGAAGVVAGAPAATAGDPGEEFGILRPQLPGEPQPRPALMPDESQMPEKYRTSPALRRRWYEAEVQKLAPVNAQRQAEDAAMRNEWRSSVGTAQERYSQQIEAARKAKVDREANMTFLERNPEYRYVPLGASLVSGSLANVLGRIARGKQGAWNAELRGLTDEARAATAAGDTARAEQLSGGIRARLDTPEPSGDLSWKGYAAAAGVAPELAAAPTIIDYATPGRPREEAKKDLQDPTYWAKTYGVPTLLGLSAAKTGTMLNRPVPSAVPGARGAMAEVDTAVSQAAAREQSALATTEAERARLQSVLDEQARKRSEAAAKAKATRDAKREAADLAAARKRRRTRPFGSLSIEAAE